MSAMASQITTPMIVYSTVYSGVDQRKYQSYASLAFVRGIHRLPVNSPHKGPVTRKMFPFDDVIMFLSTIPSHVWGLDGVIQNGWRDFEKSRYTLGIDEVDMADPDFEIYDTLIVICWLTNCFLDIFCSKRFSFLWNFCNYRWSHRVFIYPLLCLGNQFNKMTRIFVICIFVICSTNIILITVTS